MKSILLGLAMLSVGCAAPTAPVRHPAPNAIHRDLGDPCVDEFGRSGYMVSSGRGELVCQAL